MEPISREIIEQAIAILGMDGIAEETIKSKMDALVTDTMTARRLRVWIPEAFGLVLAFHIGRFILPKTFNATASDGKTRSFEMTEEPIFVAALPIAVHIRHNGPRNVFKNISLRSAVIDAVNNALNASVKLDGTVMSGLALNGIPAEVYTDLPFDLAAASQAEAFAQLGIKLV